MASQVPFRLAQVHQNLETMVFLATMTTSLIIAQHFVHPQGLFRKLLQRSLSQTICALVEFNYGSDPRYLDESLPEYFDTWSEPSEECLDELVSPPCGFWAELPLPLLSLFDRRCSVGCSGDDKSNDETALESLTDASSPTTSSYESLPTLTENSASSGYSSLDTPFTPSSPPSSPKTASYFPHLKRIQRTYRPEKGSFPPVASMEAEFAVDQNELLGRPPRRTEPSLKYQWTFFEGEPTREFDAIQKVLEPLSLLIVLTPSNDPLVMQRRYLDLVVFLSSDIIMSRAAAIHSIDICMPHCTGFAFESASHPYDNSDSGYYGVCDALDPMRYKNEFPNLVEFGWEGPLGRRKGDGVYAALPAPFHDIVSLPFSQMRRLDFRQCFLTLSDCCLMLDSSPCLETLVVDTLVGTSLLAPSPGSQYDPPPVWPEAPLHGHSALGFIRVDGLGLDKIEAPSLTCLEVRTTVNIGHFLWQLDAPHLEVFVYEPAGVRLGNLARSNCPWTGLKASLQRLVLRVPGYEKAAVGDLQAMCELKGIEMELYTPAP